MQNMLDRLFHRAALPNISIMGLDDAGKTTILTILASTPITTTIPTVGMTIETADMKIQAPTGKKFGFTAWVAEVGGCSKLPSLVYRWMLRDTTSGIVWVVDASDADRLVESREELQRILRRVDDRETDYANSIPIMMHEAPAPYTQHTNANLPSLLTKTDLPNNQPLPTIRAQLDPILTARPHAFFETTPIAPLASSGLAEAFAWLADALAETPNTAHPTLPKAEKSTADNLVALRSPTALSTTLESWLARAEKDIPAESLLTRFEALDLDTWDHYTHLRLCYILLLKHGRREGPSIRSLISPLTSPYRPRPY